jgi:hypothetical protein
MSREIDVPMLLSTLLRRQVSALVSSTAHEIAAFTERDPAEEEVLLCKALSAHLANRANLFRGRSEEVNGRERGAKA